MSSIGTAQRWFPPEMRGFIGSLVLSGYGFGSLMWIPLETAFVNPGNEYMSCTPSTLSTLSIDNVAPVSSTCWPLNDSASMGGNCKNETDKYFVDENVLRRWAVLLFISDNCPSSSFYILHQQPIQKR